MSNFTREERAFMCLSGSPEVKQELLNNVKNADRLIRRAMSYIEGEARRRKTRPEFIIGHVFSEGSGMSNAIWEYYKQEPHEKD